MNGFCTMELNVGLAWLTRVVPGVIKIASARMSFAKAMDPQKIHDIGKRPIMRAAGHTVIISEQAPSTRH